MKVVIAPDKFKGSLDARDVASAMAAGVRAAVPDAIVDLCPVADGGEGTVATLVAATGGCVERRRVTGPLPEMKVDADFGVLGDGRTAVIEMAAASGLALLRADDRDPMSTTTFGTGELLMEAAKLGVEHIILGIGGSATVDGGIGAAQACGLPVLLEGGEPVSMTEPLCGRDLDRVILVKHGRGSAIERVRITVACDVSNPLHGPNGAAPVYGPQKGATPQQVRELDEALRHLAERLGKVELAQSPGTGAAGGLGFGMLAFFGATLRRGAELVIEAVKLRERLAGADLCLTGEGKLDGQSLAGKTVIGVAEAARDARVPCIALAGAIGHGIEDARAHGLCAWFGVCDGPMTLDEAMSGAAGRIKSTTVQVMRTFVAQESARKTRTGT